METEPQIVQTYVATGKAKLVYRHLLQLGEATVRAAEASECAGDQAKFWEMRHLLYERQAQVYGADASAYAGWASELGMNADQFSECMASNKHLTEVQADDAAAQREGIRNRPSFNINGQQLVGAVPFAQFQQVIDAANS